MFDFGLADTESRLGWGFVCFGDQMHEHGVGSAFQEVQTWRSNLEAQVKTCQNVSNPADAASLR